MSDIPQSRLVITPHPGIDAIDALATSMYASPGLYAVLLGAGMSISAGKLSAWGILHDLIRQVARSGGTDLPDGTEELERWWEEKTGLQPHYGMVLETLEQTSAARQHRLYSYFDSCGDGGQAVIGRAHEELAGLCSLGYIKVVLTTNFDDLIEQSLASKNVSYQVVIPQTLSTMMPLVHSDSRVTVIKLHGDYRSINIRNTPEELSSYSRPLAGKVKEILRDYGLVVLGWSGEWDAALRRLMQSNSSRMYPLYWVQHNGTMGQVARDLVGDGRGHIIDSQGAEEFISELGLRISRLSQAAERRHRPNFLRDFHYSPYTSFQLPDSLPAEILCRTAVLIGPSAISESGLITPNEHRKVLSAIDNHQLSNELRDLMGTGLLFGQGPSRWRESLPRWEISEDEPLSGDFVAFRLNLESENVKIVARLIIVSPAHQYVGDGFLTLLDVGITSLKARNSSDSRTLKIYELSEILRGCLEMLSDAVPRALASITASVAVPYLAEFHVARPEPRDGSGEHPVDLDEFIDLSTFGSRSGRSARGIDRLCTAFQFHGPLTRVEAIDLVVEAIERMVLNNGYTAYEKATALLRDMMLAAI